MTTKTTTPATSPPIPPYTGWVRAGRRHQWRPVVRGTEDECYAELLGGHPGLDKIVLPGTRDPNAEGRRL
jgi:hypothetical protein